MVNLPLALIGGVVTLSVTGIGLSVASTVGFITLFVIAIRNGVLLVNHYEHLMCDVGLPAAGGRRPWVAGAAVLMTALTAGMALIPLSLAGHEAGNEVQSPMAIVIPGGPLSSTFQNLVVVPALFARWGGAPEAVSVSEE